MAEEKVDLSKYLNDQKQIMLNKINSKFKGSNTPKKCLELQKFLNGIFYSKGKHSNKSAGFDQKVIATFKTMTGKTLEKLDNENFWATVSTASSVETKYMALRSRWEDFHHTQKINTKTLKTRLDSLTEAFDKLKDVKLDELPDESKELKNMIGETITLYKNALEELGIASDSEDYWIELKENDDLIKLIQSLDDAYKGVSVAPITTKDYGELFEYALGIAALVAEQAANNVTNLIIDENFSDAVLKKVTGQQHTGGEDIISLNAIVGSKVNIDKDAPKKDVNVSLVVGSKKDGGFTINTAIPKANASRPGKMDVQFNFSDGDKTPFRISAKNWIASRDFGESSLLSILQRTAPDEKSIQRYMYALGTPTGNSLESAHNFAKMAIVLDTLVGYSQKENWVDTLVINDRKNGKIIVEHIPTLVNKYAKGDTSSKLSVIGYPEGVIRDYSEKLYESHISEAKDIQRYRAEMLAKLAGHMTVAKYTPQL